MLPTHIAVCLAACALASCAAGENLMDDGPYVSRSGDFCTDLKEVIAAASSGFEDLRGDASAAYPNAYPRPSIIAGARPVYQNGSACQVEEDTRVNPPVFGYYCTFAGRYPAGIAEGTEEFAAKVAACLGAQLPVPTASGVYRTFKFDRVGVQVTVKNSIPPDGGWSDITLSVVPLRPDSQ